VITALPSAAFDLTAWRTPPAEPTRTVVDGDLVDLGDRAFEVLHVPGHTAGSIALWDAGAGQLFTGDTAALDDPLHAEDEAAFVTSLGRLRAVPVELVCAGHFRPFGREELRSLIDEQLAARSSFVTSREAHGEHGIGVRPTAEAETHHERTARAAPARPRPPMQQQPTVVRQVRLDRRRLIGSDRLAGRAIHRARAG
jgi:glyoxylase-like metal-dependent hydrolase (beta-lactamase superfamily II)